MTFAVVLSSRTAIWACADRQLTDAKTGLADSIAGTKITCIETTDGIALLTYAGIGRVRGTQVSKWVYRTLRGLNWPLERSLERISDAAQRRLVGHARSARIGHCFMAAAIRDGRHYIYEINPIINPRRVIRHEPRTRTHVRIGLGGSGAIYATRYETDRLKAISRLVRQYERSNVSASFVASRLADLNVAVSNHARIAGNNTVSAESIVVHRHPKGKRGGGALWAFDAGGNFLNNAGTVPTVSNGMPLSEITDVLMGHFIEQMQRHPPGSPRPFPDMEKVVAELVAQVPDTPNEDFD